jgi:Na+(H+)/acetate symporter ActP
LRSLDFESSASASSATPAASARHLIQREALFPLENPGVLGIPLGFLGPIFGTLVGRERATEARLAELIDTLLPTLATAA